MYRIGLHGKCVGPVFFFKFCGFNVAGELSRLPDRYEAGSEAQGQGRSEEEASGVEADNDIWDVVGAENFEYLEFVCSNKVEMETGRREERQDIFEQDAFLQEHCERGFQVSLEWGVLLESLDMSSVQP